MLITIRQVSGRTEKEQEAAADGASRVELRNMCSVQSLPIVVQVVACGCGQSQCPQTSRQLSGHQLAGQGAAIPVVSNEAYDASCSFAMRDKPAPPISSTSYLSPAPPPPPPYPGTMEVRAKVKSMHEYDYIKPRAI